AVKYGLSVSDLTAMNGLTNKNVLNVCQKLSIKQANDFQAKSVNNSYIENNYSKSYNQYVKQQGRNHYVQPGETLVNIARLYGYTTEKFKEINNLAAYETIGVGYALMNTSCICPDAPLPAKTITKSAETRTNNPNTSTSTATQNPSNSSTTNMSTAGGSLKLDPAKYRYMQSEELQMLEEINLIRSNPKGYIPYIQQYIKDVKSGKSFGFGDPVTVSYELIKQLENTAPLSILEPAECVYRAAKIHGEDRKGAGSNDHVGTDGSWPWDRILKECDYLKDGNENLVGGPSSIRKAVILLLVDDGIPNRGHRSTLLNPSWKYAACYKIGTVGNMPNSWVQNFAY
ncbi:MAG: LysM repeat protein, partial [Saprospiraceae bacterium]